MQVKRVAKELLTVLRREKLVLDWRKEQATRAGVLVAVEEVLDRLPEKFTQPIYREKCNQVYEHVFKSYWDDGHSVYDLAAAASSPASNRPNPSRNSSLPMADSAPRVRPCQPPPVGNTFLAYLSPLHK